MYICISGTLKLVIAMIVAILAKRVDTFNTDVPPLSVILFSILDALSDYGGWTANSICLGTKPP